jgi:hypothetical protein
LTFADLATATRELWEPHGYRVHVQTNDQRIVITETVKGGMTSPISSRLKAIADGDLADRTITPGEASDILEALKTAHRLLDEEGYFSDPEYPEVQMIALVLGV